MFLELVNLVVDFAAIACSAFQKGAAAEIRVRLLMVLYGS
jgi:hypothetical protein